MEQPVTKVLLKKFLENQCTPQETQVVLKWLEEPGTEQLLHEILTEEWQERMENTSEENPGDLQMQGWKRRIRVLTQEANKQQIKRSKPFFLKYAAIWTTMILGLGTYGILHFKKTKNLPVIAMQEITNPNGKRSIITLPDSSVVYLGAGSKICFPVTFANNKREISLQGEAFFDVKHKIHQSFIVHTGNLQTRDIGTSFKITAFENHPVTVALASGKVRIERVKNKSIQILGNLLPGQQSVWENDKLVTSSIPVNDITGWKDGHLVFDGTPLNELTTVLERWYNVKIIYSNASKKKVSVTTALSTAHTSIISVMDALSVTEHFKYSIQGNQITIN